MDEFCIKLNDLLVNTFRSILKFEERMLKNSDKIDLSISEMHLIECVGKDPKGKNISDIAKELEITLPSVTIAINKLMKKGYVQKIRCVCDARVVYVMLTKKGQKIDAAHRYFHENMVRAISKGLSDEDKKALINGIIKLNAFFKQKLGNSEA